MRKERACMKQTIYNQLKTIIPEHCIRIDEPMALHTTFQVGGPADFYITIEETALLEKLLPFLKTHKIPYYIIGHGSNLLVSDKGYKGVVISLEPKVDAIQVKENRLTIPGGVLLGTVAKKAVEFGLAGFEFAAGIPGTIGGAVMMNAGAYDGEMKDIVLSVTMVNEQGSKVTFSNEELLFGYRTSILKTLECIVTEVTIELTKGDQLAIREKMQDFQNRRKEKQPLMFPSAGSTFKRPEGHFAGKLIMDAGLAGYRIGGACVSPMHCGCVVNDQKGTARDIYGVIQHTTEQVEEQFGIKLELEVICLGEF